MDLKALWLTTHKLTQKRENKSESLTLQGFDYISRAESPAEINREYLKEASVCFIQAMRQNPQQASPYIGLAYLFLLVSDTASAKAQLLTAQQWEPENADVQKMLNYIEDGLSKSTETRENIDYESLFDQVVARIENQLEILEKSAPPSLSLNSKSISALQAQKSALETFIEALNPDLALLDQEYNIDEVLGLLKPLKAAVNQYKKLMVLVQIFQAISAEIQALSQALKEGILNLSKPNSNLDHLENVSLEAFLDQKEHLSRQILELQAEGHDTRSLTASFHVVDALLENFIDRLDAL